MGFHEMVMKAKSEGELVVQPRMGFTWPAQMYAGLLAVSRVPAWTVGTITIDSYNRVGGVASAARALADGDELNGFPIRNHGAARTRDMLKDLQSQHFQIQARHGSALADDLFTVFRDSQIDASEGGPVSYCLPYSRTPLSEAIVSWRRCAQIAAECGMHVETFGGCLLGQMCPPSMLVAISVLEAIFFARHGVTSVSLSYAQQTSTAQDVGAIRALRKLAVEFLGDVDFHVVHYTYMGVFPRTVQGSQDILRESVRIARQGGAERLIVKTVAEAHRIPTIEENVAALQLAADHWRSLSAAGPDTLTVDADMHGARRRSPDLAVTSDRRSLEVAKRSAIQGDLRSRLVRGRETRAQRERGIARQGGAERLIVKTVAEAHRIPTIEENVAALQLAADHWRSLSAAKPDTLTLDADMHQALIMKEARSLIEAVLNLHADVGEGLRLAFQAGYLDIPYCLHQDNLGQARAVVDNTDGTLQWNRIGRLPIQPARLVGDSKRLDPFAFHEMLSTMQRRFDAPYLQTDQRRPSLEAPDDSDD